MRISKIVIPIALAVSLVFAGVSVYGNTAQNFVVRTEGPSDVQLSLTLERDLSNQTSKLYIPFEGGQLDSTFQPDTDYSMDRDPDSTVIPNDIAQREKLNYGKSSGGSNTYMSCSFYLVNNSDRAVDVDITMNIDGLVTYDNDLNRHIDDAIRVMFIQGEPLITDNTYTVYSKAERTQENKDYLIENAPYSANTVDFFSDDCVFTMEGDNGIKNLAAGESVKFTLVFWLEGWDVECTDEIFNEMIKFSLDFTGS